MVEKNIIVHEFQGHTFYFYPTPQSRDLIKEIFADNYKVLSSKIEFPPGSVILDLGANEGMFSIMMAKLFPQATIHAFEPVPRTYAQLVRNIGLNGTVNIIPHQIGVGREHKSIPIYMGKNDYSGGSSSYLTFNPELQEEVTAEILTMDEIWWMLQVDRIRLLKSDCEGAEYDAFYPFSHLNKVDYFCGELHINSHLEFQSRRMDALATWLSNLTRVIHLDFCRMAE